jgi:hypothetical protein
VCADTGPKPSLTITVHGLNADKYWLDLLVTDKPVYSWLHISDAERNQVSRLTEYQDSEGFHPALLKGTIVPMVGSISGEKVNNGNTVHRFSYRVPTTFKIAILTDDGTLIVSDVVNRKQFTSTMQYDLSGVAVNGGLIESAGKVTEGMSWNVFMVNLLISTILTLIIEIFLACMVGFTLKKSFKVLFITNILTQIILNIIVLYFNWFFGTSGVFLGIAVGELVVIIVEAIIYLRFLIEKSASQRVLYAVMANLASIMLGFIIYLI